MRVLAAQVRAETRKAQARTVAEAEEAQALRSAAGQAGPKKWHERNAYFVGSLPVVEKATSMSVLETVDALNSGALRVPAPWLLIYSASSGGWWVVYQNRHRGAATKIFECARALAASFS